VYFVPSCLRHPAFRRSRRYSSKSRRAPLAAARAAALASAAIVIGALTAPPPPSAGPEAPPTPALAPLTLNDALDFVYARLKAEDKEPVLDRLEREMITRVLRDENGNLMRASERLGMTRTTLRKRIDTLGLKI